MRSIFMKKLPLILSCSAALYLSNAQNVFAENATAKPDIISYIQGNTSQTRYISVPKNKAAIIKLPQASRDVVVADPEMLDVVVRNPKEIYLFAKKTGLTNAFFFNEAGQQIVNLEVNVGIDIKELERVFKEQMPESKISVSNMGDTIILSGNVNNASHARIARNIANRLVDSPEKVINNIGITGQEQVMIKVKVAEIQRSILKQLGIDWNTAFNIGKFSGGFGLGNAFSTNGNPITGLASKGLGGLPTQTLSGVGGLGNFSSPESVTSYLNSLTASSDDAREVIADRISAINGNDTLSEAAKGTIIANDPTIAAANARIAENNEQLLNIQDQRNIETYKRSAGRGAGYTSNKFSADAMLKALESHALIKTLAEPNLTALSGESAKFLAGGEIPFAVPQALGETTVEYKPYGIGLAFTPTVLNENRISLKISTEVSEIGQTVGNYPALDVRRAETTVEMPSGGSLIMAGLIREDARRSIDSAPGVKDVPVLGALFRSNDFKSKESELAILVSPFLVEPTSEKNLSLPTDGYANPSDLDMYVRGRMSAVYDKNAPKKDKDWVTSLTDNEQDKQTHSAIISTDDHILE